MYDGNEGEQPLKQGGIQMMEKMRKQSVLKEVRTTGMWAGHIAASKVNAFHIDGGWVLGSPVLITQARDGKYYVVNEITRVFEELETYLRAFKWYNCNRELGQEVRFWVN
jgi:hypothetical protein